MRLEGDSKSTFIKIVGAYSLYFVLFFISVFGLFFINGKTFVWNVDGISQHYPTIIYTRHWIQQFFSGAIQGELSFPQWSLQQGLGGDIFGNSFSYRIVNWLSVLFSEEKLEVFFYFRSIVYLYFAGVAFIRYAMTKCQDAYACIIGSMIYVFSAYAIFFAPRHAFFIEMMIYFPLMCLGIDRIIDGKNSLLLVAVIFLSAASYVYFLFIISLGVAVYVLVRILLLDRSIKEKIQCSWNLILRIGAHYIVGILLAGFSVLPAVWGILHSSRGVSSQGTGLLLWNRQYYKTFFEGQLSSSQIGLYGFISFYSMGLFSLFYGFRRRRACDKVHILQIIAYYFVFLIPVLGMAFSGFAGKTHRWSFIFQFWVAMQVVVTLGIVDEENQQQTRLPPYLKAAIIAIFIMGAVGAIVFDMVVPLWILLAVICVAIIIIMRKTTASYKLVVLAEVLLVLLCLGESVHKAYQVYGGDDNSYFSQFVDSGTLYTAGMDTLAAELSEYQEPEYRVDAVNQTGAFSGTELNYGVRNGVNGVSSYYSLIDGRLIAYSQHIGNADLNTPLLFYGLDQRTVLNTLSSVKYLATANGYHVPYGYELVGESSKTLLDGREINVEIYRNKNALPIAYTYTSYIREEDYLELDANKKEQAMVQGAVIDQSLDVPQTELVFDDISLIKVSPETISHYCASEGVCSAGEGYVEVKERCSFVFPVEEAYSGEFQVLLKGIRFEAINFSDDTKWTAPDATSVSADINGTRNSCVILNNTNQYYYGARDVLLNVGYIESPGNLTVTFSQPGLYYFDSIEAIVEPLIVYSSCIDDMVDGAAYDIVVSDNTISGKVNGAEKRIVCLTVPFSEGWKLTVDGEQKEIIRVNTYQMGFVVEKGLHSFVMHYASPGLKAGVACSLVGWLLFMCYNVVIRKKRKYGGNDESIPR